MALIICCRRLPHRRGGRTPTPPAAGRSKRAPATASLPRMLCRICHIFNRHRQARSPQAHQRATALPEADAGRPSDAIEFAPISDLQNRSLRRNGVHRLLSPFASRSRCDDSGSRTRHRGVRQSRLPRSRMSGDATRKPIATHGLTSLTESRGKPTKIGESRYSIRAHLFLLLTGCPTISIEHFE